MALSTLHLAPSVQRLMASPLDKQCSKHVGTVQSVLKVMTERRGPHSEGLMAAERTRHNLASCHLGQEAGERMYGLLPPSSSKHTPGGVLYVAWAGEVRWGEEESSRRLPRSIKRVKRQLATHGDLAPCRGQAGCVPTRSGPFNVSC